MQPQPGPVQPRPDWYALLGVEPTASTEELTAAVERMSRQATALSVTAPERSRQLRDQIRAIKQDLLSSDAQRQRYDAERGGPAAHGRGPFGAPFQGQQHGGQNYGVPQYGGQPQGGQQYGGQPYQGPPAQPPPQQPPAYQPPGYGPAAGTPSWQPAQSAGSQQAQPFQGLMSRVARFLQTGWTCKTCGFGALPNDKFCHKCGSPIEPPATASGGQTGQARFGPPQQWTAGSPGQPGAPPSQPGAPPSQPAGPVAQPRGPAAEQQGSGQLGFCGKCGGAIAAGNTFCTQCGART